MNNVVRNIVDYLSYAYGVDKVYGIRGGYHGFHEKDSFCLDKKGKERQCHPIIELTPELVACWHQDGGTNLGTSRGGFDADKIIKFIEKNKINQLYVIGGDGTHRGAFALVQVVERKSNKK
jgi:6-phosphofructokinase 1